MHSSRQGDVPPRENGSGWRRVHKELPCPVCGHDSWCSIGSRFVHCMRVPSDRPAAGGEGYLHSLGDAESGSARNDGGPRAKARSEINWSRVAQRFSASIKPEQVQELADELGVDPIALRELGIGSAGFLYTFPMFAADGSICGVRTRNMVSGEKKAWSRSKLGVIRRLEPDEGLLLVCEGESDTAAALTLGFDAIGVPGAGQCTATAAAFAQGRDVVVMADDDTAGASGAAKLAQALLGTANSVRIAKPSSGFNDLREWLKAGATREDVEGAIGSADDVESDQTSDGDSPSIAASFEPLESGCLSRRPRPRDYLLRYETRDGLPAPPRQGDGFAPMGVAGFLSSEGGLGKTTLLMMLGVCIVTGRPWIGFQVDAAHVGQRVLLVLAEESEDEVHRRLFNVCEHYKLSEEERREVERRLLAVPLSGRQCPLFGLAEDGSIAPTRAMQELRDLLHESSEPWALVVLDPLARLFPSAESENRLATAAVQMVEAMTEAPGHPLLLLAHHSSKLSRRAGDVDARGVTGLTDAARWALTLKAKESGDVEFVQSKSNYSAPMTTPLTLKRVRGGILRTASEAELEEARQDEESLDAEELSKRAEFASQAVEALRRKRSKTIDGIAKLMRKRARAVRPAINDAIDDGRIVKKRIDRTDFYVVADEWERDVDDKGDDKHSSDREADSGERAESRDGVHETGGEENPHTPGDAGTPSPGQEAGTAPPPSGRPGTSWDGGTADMDDCMPESTNRKRRKRQCGQ